MRENPASAIRPRGGWERGVTQKDAACDQHGSPAFPPHALGYPSCELPIPPPLTHRVAPPRSPLLHSLLPLPPPPSPFLQVRLSLPSVGRAGLDVDVRVSRSPPPRLGRRRWERDGDDLRLCLALPAWHNALRPRVRLRHFDGGVPVPVLPAGAPSVLAARWVTIPGRGMPVRGGGATSALAADRGALKVCLTIRTPRQEAAQLLARTGAVTAAAAVLAAARQLGPTALVAAGGAAVGTAMTTADAIVGIVDALWQGLSGLTSPNAARRRRDRFAARRREARAAQARAAREVAAAATAERARRAYNWAFDKAPLGAGGG